MINIKRNTFFVQCFTLLELLVAMAVFSVMMTVLMQFFSSAQKVTIRTGDRTEIFENGRIAMELISRDLRTAYYGGTSMPMTNSGNALEFYCYSQSSDTADQLVKVKFEKPGSVQQLQLTVSGTPGISLGSTISGEMVIDKVRSLTFTTEPATFKGLPETVTVDLEVGEDDTKKIKFTKTVYIGGRGQDN